MESGFLPPWEAGHFFVLSRLSSAPAERRRPPRRPVTGLGGRYRLSRGNGAGAAARSDGTKPERGRAGRFRTR